MSDTYHLSQSSVFVRDLRIFANHGVMPQERTVGAVFVLNISIDTDFSQAAKSDDLSGTISYADVVELVRREMAVPSNLLEHVAHRIATSILQTFPTAKAVNIDLLKENPPMGADCAGAGITLTLKHCEF